MTYNIPLPDPLSNLAEDEINQVCRQVEAWPDCYNNPNTGTATSQQRQHQHSQIGRKRKGVANENEESEQEETKDTATATATTDTEEEAVVFREVMVKATRDGSLLVRVTVQRSSTITSSSNEQEHANNSDASWGASFVQHLRTAFPTIQCVCYNVAHGRARPPKTAPLYFLYGADRPYVMERTPNGISYQISPDTFSEINHEVERLQFEQTRAWMQEFEGTDAILLVSGRDISSFGVGWGSLKGDRLGEKMFSEVVACQHCPLVNMDAVANFQRNCTDVQGTVLHLTKQEMAEGISGAVTAAQERQKKKKPSVLVPVVVVLTGGRKGLDSSYITCLLENSSVICIVYNSCSTISLVRDMEHFMGGEFGFSIDGFASYDFFPGTKYRASLIRLVRRPKTLVIPVGPAGVGKSTMAKELERNTPKNTVRWWQRDEVFASLRNQAVGLNKTKQIVHQQLLSFLDTRENGDRSVQVVDSTNSSAEARTLYVQKGKPDLTILVELKPQGQDDEEVLDLLMQRTKDRLGDGKSSHPSFPNTADEQRVKHVNILKGIQYPSAAAAAAALEDPITVGGGKSGRTALLVYNPGDAARLASLPFMIFLEFSTSCALRQMLKRSIQV
jgi:tRNA/tmRNA/rRNA uracil-C5-methylase (TrmA/RlmC/RlmD family)